MNRGLALFLLVVLAAPFSGCEEDTAEPEAVADEVDQADEADQAVEADPADEAEQVDEQARADDALEAVDFEYPGMALDLTAAQLGELASLAEAELCPCEDSVVSLHECMQEEERCEDADEMTGTLVAALSEGGEAEDAFDRVAQERGSTEREHTFHLGDSPYKGNPDADVVIVEFADFQCPHCRTAAQAMDVVADRFGDDVVIYFKYFPLGSPLSDQAAQAAAAAHQQDRFWQMHGLLFENQRQLSAQQIQGFARQLGMNFERFQQDMRNAEVQRNVARDRQEGMAAGVQGTPAIFINGKQYTGAITPQAIGANVNSLLEGS